ncbi:hypothetical protein ACKVWC_005561 [Pyricularia oryzae]
MPPTKAILCLHGGGTSGNIFRMQLAKIRLQLKDEFEFVFMDAPYPADAGPGILPIFAAAAPFFGWFGGSSADIDGRLETINTSVRAAIEGWAASRTTLATIVGILAFSEGALAASMLLWQQERGRLPWLPVVRFAVLISCFFPRPGRRLHGGRRGGYRAREDAHTRPDPASARPAGLCLGQDEEVGQRAV